MLNYLHNIRYVNRDLAYKYNIHFDIINNKLYFPSYDINGNMNSYICRNTGNKANYHIEGVKHEFIFNEYMIDFKKPIFLVEGIFDSIRIQNSIPLLGTELNENFLLFKKIYLENSKVFIILDNELKVINKLINMCDLFIDYNIEVYVGEIITEHNDIGSMSEINIDNFKFYKYDLEYKLNKEMR